MLVAASLALAGVFAIAACSKLADRPGLRRSMVAFGVPGAAAPALAWLLIACELTVAGALLIPSTRVSGGIAALGLLAGLSAVVAINVARGRSVECHCFGQLSRGAVGWSALARNGALASIAGYVAAGGRYPGLFAALALGCGVAWAGTTGPGQRVRDPASAREDPSAPDLASAPDFSLNNRAGQRWSLEDLLARRRPVLLVFSHPGCGACQVLFSELAGWHHRLAGRLTVAVLQSAGPGEDGYQEGGDLVLRDEAGAAARTYGVSATPSAALIDADGRMAAALARGPGEILELVGARFPIEDTPRVGRRAVIGRAVQSAAALGAFPLVAAACGSSKTSSRAATAPAPSTTTATTSASRPASVKVGSTYICQQTYALCTNAPCVPSPRDPTKVICDCVVKDGYSVGFTSCPHRAPHGSALYSTFSTALATSAIRALTCPAHVPWANCLDSPCELDPHDHSKARCLCPLVMKGPSFTFGGDCSTKSCGHTIWSGAHTNAGGGAVAKEMEKLGQPLTLPPPCPKS
jgi:hypothetical protein